MYICTDLTKGGLGELCLKADGSVLGSWDIDLTTLGRPGSGIDLLACWGGGESQVFWSLQGKLLPHKSVLVLLSCL